MSKSPKFQARHYKDIAALLLTQNQESLDFEERNTIRNVVLSFCTMFAEDNPRFDRARFREACGFGD